MSEFRRLVREVRLIRLEQERSRLWSLARSLGESSSIEMSTVARALVPEAFQLSTLIEMVDRVKDMEAELAADEEADEAQGAAAGPST